LELFDLQTTDVAPGPTLFPPPSTNEPLTAANRAELYNKAFPRYPAVWSDKDWLMGQWNLGAMYVGSGYYGSFPPGLLKRVMPMFPDAKQVLHLFSGSLPSGRYTRLDFRMNRDDGVVPDVRGDAHALPFLTGSFDLAIADPPYSAEDAVHYGVAMVDRRRVFHECTRVLKPGGNLVWLDSVHPMYRKTDLRLWGQIGIVRSTNHRYRILTMLQRVCS
jgi:SAM-dependent methyltransferase